MKSSEDKEHPVLSISLLVSNRIDTIRKCMDSLCPLMKAVPSELIAVDTGGTDGSIDIVKEYTENIIKFAWCDNFAAARNAGLMKASGEWFLFLDDDEWFENTDEIADFFLSGKYKTYESAQYLVRNYASNGTKADAYVSRMCKLSPNLHFIGSIHEYLSPINEPTMYFGSFVHHYGYYYNTEEDKKKHFERNVALLKKELRKDPSNIRYLCQLAQEYETVEDFKNEESICRLALNNLHGKDITASKSVNWILAALIRVLSLQGKREEAIKEGKKFLEKYMPFELSRAVIFVYMEEEAIKLKLYPDALLYAVKYLNTIHLLETNPEMAKTQSMMTMTLSYARNLYRNVMLRGLEACCGAMDFTNVELFLTWLFDSEKNPQVKEISIFIEDLKTQYPKAAGNLIEKLASLENKSQLPYLLLQELLFKSQSDGYNSQLLYDFCIKRCLEEQIFFEQLLAVAGRENLIHTVMLESMERKEWEDWITASAAHLTADELWGVKNGLDKTPASGLKYLSFTATLDRQLLIKETELIKENNKENNEIPVRKQYYDALYNYCKEGLCYFRRLYKNEVFTEEEGINLPKECRFLLHLEKGFQLEKARNLIECLSEIKKAVNINPQMASTVSPYIDTLDRKKTNPAENEFYQLGENIKCEAKKLIKECSFNEAKEILKKLQNLLPEDREILGLLKQTDEKL